MALPLDVAPRDPLLRIDQVVHSRERGPVEYSITHYRPNRYRPQVRLARAKLENPLSRDAEPEPRS